jgi:hypothetical protein
MVVKCFNSHQTSTVTVQNLGKDKSPEGFRLIRAVFLTDAGCGGLSEQRGQSVRSVTLQVPAVGSALPPKHRARE